MKEIIYLDTDNLNSLLAQLGKGIINDFTEEDNISHTQGESSKSKKGVNNETRAGITPIILKRNEYSDEQETTSTKVIEGQRDLLNKQFHDYSLNILLEKLKEHDLIVESDFKEGDIIESMGKFDFYDFSLINKAANAEQFLKIMELEDIEDDSDNNISDKEANTIIQKIQRNQQLTKKQESHKDEAMRIHLKNQERNNITEIMKGLEIVSSTANGLFSDLTLFKTNNIIGLTKKEFLRESAESLSFRSDNTRKAKFIGRVIGVKDKIFDGEDFEFEPAQINKLPNMILDILLNSFNIIESGNLLISPIAIYYESN